MHNKKLTSASRVKAEKQVCIEVERMRPTYTYHFYPASRVESEMERIRKVRGVTGIKIHKKGMKIR